MTVFWMTCLVGVSGEVWGALAGTLRMRCCSFTFFGRRPTWSLLGVGVVSTLVDVRGLSFARSSGDVHLPSPGFWNGVRKKIRITKKPDSQVDSWAPSWETANPHKMDGAQRSGADFHCQDGDVKRGRMVQSHAEEPKGIR